MVVGSNPAVVRLIIWLYILGNNFSMAPWKIL